MTPATKHTAHALRAQTIGTLFVHVGRTDAAGLPGLGFLYAGRGEAMLPVEANPGFSSFKAASASGFRARGPNEGCRMDTSMLAFEPDA